MTLSTVFAIDLTTPPQIYRTDNPDYYGKLVIDFQGEDIPTICAFDDLKQVKKWLVKTFGKDQYNTWFPYGVAEMKVIY